MKVLFLSSYYNNYVHDQIIELTKILDEEPVVSFHEDLWCYFRSKKLQQKHAGGILDNEIPKKLRHLIKYPGLPKNILFAKLVYFLYLQTYNKIKKQKFDIIHAHTLFPSGYVAYLLAKKLKIPFVVTTHGLDFYRCLPNISKTRQYKPFNQNVISKINTVLENANNIIAVSKNFASDIKQYNAKANVVTIENSYRKELFKPGDKLKAKLELGLNQNDFVILSVGNFLKTKGHDVLIKAFAIACQKNKNAKLVLIGGGPNKTQYLNLAKQLNVLNKITVIDYIKPPQLKQWYLAASVYAMPSRNEAFGIALVEAMACGLPAVASLSQGPSEIISNNVDGFLSQIENHEQLAFDIIKLYNNDLNAKMGKLAATNMLKKYGYKVAEVFDLYKKILNKD